MRSSTWLGLAPFAVAAALFTALFPAPSLTAQVPTFQEVAGHELGERITLHHQMVRYMEALDRDSDRVQVVNQGRSYEGNDLLLAIITHPDHHAELDRIQERAQLLGDPRGLSADEAARLIEDQPAVVWLGGSIHGFELSGSEGFLKILERLATRDDPETIEVLRNVVVLIDPMLNPDGRDAHARHNHENIGRVPSPERDDWSNDFTSWESLKYRTSHYYHDINRDWFAHTHPESRNRVGTIRDWRPQALVDAHEMSQDVEFYFDPPTDPYPPYFPEYARWGFDLYNQGYVEAFDREGYEYMTGERYNYFYPGYTTAFGTYQGAVGMLFEQGSTRGLAMTRPDGSVRTLRDALDQQYTAGWATLTTTARNRAEILERYVLEHREAVADGEQGVRRYILTPERGDPHLLREVVNLLIRSGIEVDRLTASTSLSGVRDRYGSQVGSRSFPSGSYVIEAAQPRNRFIRTLLEPHTPVPEGFLALARERVDRGENPRFYDITAWSLPLYFNQAGFSATDGRGLQLERVTEEVAHQEEGWRRAGYAYLVDGANARSVSVAAHLRERDRRAGVMTVPTRIGGRDVPSGTIVVRVGQNDEGVHDDVRDLAARYGVHVRAVDSGAGDPGWPALGSGDVYPVVTPTIGLVGDFPVNGYSFGFAWHTLDVQYRIPLTVLKAGSLAGADLRRFNVLVLPEVSGGTIQSVLGESGMDQLRRWVRQGGTLVALGSAVDFVIGPLGLTGLRSWYDGEQGQDAVPFTVPGAFFRGELNRAYWLTSGLPEGELPFQVRSSRLYLPPEGPPAGGRRVVGTFADDPHISGHAWPESLERIGGTVFAYEERVGSGRVIAIAEDVNFRSYSRGVQRLFLNAAVLGPSAP